MTEPLRDIGTGRQRRADVGGSARGRRTWALGTAIGLLVAMLGCGPRAMPPGTGASGKQPLDVITPDYGYGLINRLSSEQREVLKLLHRPFSEVATIRPDLPEAEQKRLSEWIENWNSILFADPEKGRGERYYRIFRLFTTAGPISIISRMEPCPDHARSFAMLASEGFYDGQEFRLEDDGGRIVAGTSPEDAWYWLEPRRFPGSIGKYWIVAEMADESRSPGTQFGIVWQEPFRRSDSMTVLGRIFPDVPGDISLDTLYEKIKAGDPPVRIERIEVVEYEEDLFDPENNNARLPAFDPEGRMTFEGVLQLPRSQSSPTP